MGLTEEIEEKSATIHTDGYPMSIGELANLYRDKELDIHPEFQRFFRWNNKQKSRLIESILLGIPIPSLFVQQRKDGVWDVIDGLQRLSTIFELMGLLRNEENQVCPSLILQGTTYLPSLQGKSWGDDESDENILNRVQQLIIKRSKLDIKIVLSHSDETSKYELFQRLNTGGSQLSDQEIRNCLVIMVNGEFYKWLIELSKNTNFNNCISLSERPMEEQYNMELIVRFLVFRKITESQLKKIDDLGTFLNEEIIKIAGSDDFDKRTEEEAFNFTFKTLSDALQDDSFRRYDPQKDRFLGSFLISAFETLAIGLGYNFEIWREADNLPNILEIAKKIWSNRDFLEGIGSGVRASSRIPVTIPFGRAYLKP